MNDIRFALSSSPRVSSLIDQSGLIRATRCWSHPWWILRELQSQVLENVSQWAICYQISAEIRLFGNCAV